MARYVSLLASLAKARLRRTGEHLRKQTLLVTALVGTLALALIFGLAATTVALASRLGVLEALLVMTAVSLTAGGVAALLLVAENRRHRRRKAQPARVEDAARVALLGLMPRGLRPTARVAGLGLVLLGALLVLSRRRDDE